MRWNFIGFEPKTQFALIRSIMATADSTCPRGLKNVLKLQYSRCQISVHVWFLMRVKIYSDLSFVLILAKKEASAASGECQLVTAEAK